jgi:hypothetical protein
MTIGDRLWRSDSSSNGDEDNGSQTDDTEQDSENEPQSDQKGDGETEPSSTSAPPLEVALTAASEGTRTRVRNFQTYWENQRMAAYFMIYSILVAVLLAGLSYFTDDIQLMIDVLLVYGFSSIPFFVWLGRAVEDSETDDVWT